MLDQVLAQDFLGTFGTFHFLVGAFSEMFLFVFAQIKSRALLTLDAYIDTGAEVLVDLLLVEFHAAFEDTVD